MQLNACVPASDMSNWEDQVEEYPEYGPVGISYFSIPYMDFSIHVDCILHRDEFGLLRGLLKYYPKDGNIDLWVDPDFWGQGIGISLIKEADICFNVNWEKQIYTKAGASLVKKFLNARLIGID